MTLIPSLYLDEISKEMKRRREKRKTTKVTEREREREQSLIVIWTYVPALDRSARKWKLN